MAVNSTRRRAPGRSGVVGALVSWSDELHRCHDCGLNRVCLHRHRIRCRGQHGRAIDRSLADRLTAITTVPGQATVFTIDALGRHASRAVGANPTESYSYLGSSNTVIGIASSAGTTTSAIDAIGNRVATAGGGAVGFLLPDLHGNTAGALNAAATSITDAFAYDAYGNTVASVTSALPTPWRYQGRILESAAGTPDLYDFGARSYSPTIGTFTSCLLYTSDAA